MQLFHYCMPTRAGLKKNKFFHARPSNNREKNRRAFFRARDRTENAGTRAASGIVLVLSLPKHRRPAVEERARFRAFLENARNAPGKSINLQNEIGRKEVRLVLARDRGDDSLVEIVLLRRHERAD